MHDFLPTLSTTSKWFAERRNLTNGDVVLVVDPDIPRGKWPLGRISTVHPGGDVSLQRLQAFQTSNLPYLPMAMVVGRALNELCSLKEGGMFERTFLTFLALEL